MRAIRFWLLLEMAACHNHKDANLDRLEPVDGVATDISVEIYSNGWGTLLETRTLETEGSMACDTVEDEPYSTPSQFYLYASADGYWTELYTCTFGDDVTIDLDQVPEVSGAIAGSVFETQVFFADHAYASSDLLFEFADGSTQVVTTDEQGRFGLAEAPEGEVDVSLECEEETFTFSMSNAMEGTDYQDLLFESPLQAAAPIVYLRPEQTTDVEVLVDFPNGGHVTLSDPPYNDGWHVTAAPDGTIDGQWPYLFYEGNIPPIIQDDVGWVLDGDDLEAGLRTLLAATGFKGREIDDFIDWWIDDLSGPPYLAIYPQDPENYTVLAIDPVPDSLLRSMWMVRPFYYPVVLPEPAPPEPFERNGFVVTEWGVVVGI